MINLALCGVGRWGKNFIKTINSLRNIRIHSLFSSNPDNCKLIKPQNDPLFSFYYEWETLLRNARLNKIDGVIITTPPSTHKNIIETCLKYKLPFLCEKPICDNLKDTVEICDLIEKSQVPGLIDYTQLYNPAFIKLKELIAGKDINFINSVAVSYGPFRDDVLMLWDWLPHDLSMMLSLNKNPTFKIKTILGSHRNSGRLILDDASNSIYCFIDNENKEKYRSFTVNTGSTKYSIYNNTLKQYGEDVSEYEEILVDKASPLENVVNQFVNVIKNNILLDTSLTRKIAEKINEIEQALDK